MGLKGWQGRWRSTRKSSGLGGQMPLLPLAASFSHLKLSLRDFLPFTKAPRREFFSSQASCLPGSPGADPGGGGDMPHSWVVRGGFWKDVIPVAANKKTPRGFLRLQLQEGTN